MSTVGRDPGLQPERTRLAAVRTGLALAISLLVLARLTAAELGPVAWLAAVLGLVTLGVTYTMGETGRASTAVRVTTYAVIVTLLGSIEIAALLVG